jgi:hypothetical protein
MGAFFGSLVGFWNSLPHPVAAILILGFGWLVALFLRLLVSSLLSAIKVDRLSERTGLKEFLRKGNVENSISKLVSVILYWLVLVASFIASALALDVRIVNELGAKAAGMLPGILAAALIAAVGLVIVGFLANFTATIARNAGFPNARLLARVIKWAGYLFVVSIALDQAGVGRNLIGPVFLVLLGGISLGGALAFGLGCKDMAREAMDRFIRTLMERGRDGNGDDMEG